MSHRNLALTLACAALLALGATAPTEAADDDNFALAALKDVALGEPLQKGPLILIPLVALSDPIDPGVVPAVDNADVGFFEPDFPRRRHDVGVRNDSDKPVLLLGGSVLVGGKRDRMTRHTRILAPEAVAELRAMTAAAISDKRKDAVPFEMSNTLAPIYLRRQGDFGANLNAVDTFVSRWLDFRNAGDGRKSLEAIAQSEALKTFCLACQTSMSGFPAPIDGYRVIGAITAVRARVQSLCLFGTNDLLRAHFETLLRSASYAAAAIDIRADKAKIPGGDGKGDPDEIQDRVLQDAQDLLTKLRKAKFKAEDVPDGTTGTSLMIRTSSRTRGRAIGVDGKLVYLTVYPYDPFETALYSRTLEIPDEEDGVDIDVDVVDSSDQPGIAELNRRSRLGRLTPYEQRLVDRLRSGGGGRMGPSPGSMGRSGGGGGVSGGGGGGVGRVGGGGGRRR